MYTLLSDALNICESSGFLKAFYLIKIILMIVAYLLPILLIIALTLEIMKVITDVDKVKEVVKSSKNKLIAALIIIFIPTIINIVLNALGTQNSFSACYNNSNKEYIAKREKIEQNEKINSSTTTTTKKTTKVEKKITSGEFIYTLNDMKYYLNIPSESTENMPLIIYLGGDGIDTYFSDNNTESINKLHELPIVNSAVNNESYKYGKYILLVPQGKRYRQSMTLNGKTSYYMGTTWIDDDTPNTVLNIINTVVNKYNIDKNKISITGFSRGTSGVWNYAYSNPNFFSAALPVSGCGLNSSDYPSKLANTDIFAATGYDHNGAYTDCMSTYVNNINKNGGNAKYYYTNTSDHGYNQTIIFSDYATYKWLLCNTKGINKNCEFPK